MYISIEQALSVYDELVRCYYKENGYGTDVCELYTYKLLPYSSSYSQNWNNPDAIEFLDFLKMERKAAASLKNIVDIFSDNYNCKVLVEDYKISIYSWYEEVMGGTYRFCHRIHLKVIRDEKMV